MKKVIFFVGLITTLLNSALATTSLLQKMGEIDQEVTMDLAEQNKKSNLENEDEEGFKLTLEMQQEEADGRIKHTYNKKTGETKTEYK